MVRHQGAVRRAVGGGLAILLCLAILTSSHGDERPNWNQWRGPTRDGQVNDANWPNTLSEDRLIQNWRVELGPSYSGPIVAEECVFATATEEKKFEEVTAWERKTGKKLWSNRWEGAMNVPFFANSNGSWIRSTPAWNDGRLYVAGMRDLLVCIDVATGDTLWKMDFVEQFSAPLPAFGFVCSPLVDGDSVYVQAGASFARLEKGTGRVVWRSMKDQGGMNDSAFSSPILSDLQGRRQLLVQGRETLAGIDPETGSELWRKEIPAFRGMNILTPIVWRKRIFTSSYGGQSLLLTPDGESAEERWSNKVQGYMSTPVVVDGHLYMHLRNQRFTCIDLESGETRWTSQPYGKYSSLITNGKLILALDERGELLLIEPTPKEFRLVAERQISKEETWAHVAISGDQLFIRELNALAAYTWK